MCSNPHCSMLLARDAMLGWCGPDMGPAPCACCALHRAPWHYYPHGQYAKPSLSAAPAHLRVGQNQPHDQMA